MASTIFHFTHPHELVKTQKEETFKCKMCEFPGSGNRYSCNLCNFNLHEDCFSCPPIIHYFAHPMHELTLSPSNSIFSRNKHCDLCLDHVHGYSYRCDPCKFNVHLPCLLMPETMNSGLHQQHELRLVYFGEGRRTMCSACGKGKVPCLFSCEPCGVAYHPKCIRGGEGDHLLRNIVVELGLDVVGDAVANAVENMISSSM